jgi:hypothetical protein
MQLRWIRQGKDTPCRSNRFTELVLVGALGGGVGQKRLDDLPRA